jgi:hypothetical protein
MKQELEDKIIHSYADIFYEEGRGPNRKSTLIGNQISCGDGWFNIIMEICEEIYAMRPKVQQIKEKFGGLRFYASFPKDYSEQGWAVIRKAEEKASKTCETCGEPGELRIRNGWRYLGCQKCHDQYCEENEEEEYP